MKAILSHQPGPPSSLVLEEIDKPEPGPGEVLVKVNIAALNFFDSLIIEDRYQTRPPRPFSPAAEMAGTVAAVGDQVEGFSPGDRVCGYLTSGCAREFIALPQQQLTMVPDRVSDEHAACILVTYGTSYHALKDRAQLRPGETLAVLGASGGVGQSAVELGKIIGARVIACASSAEKLDFCQQCGADEVINYSREDLKTRLKELTGGKGVDVIYDPVGGAYSEAAFRAIGIYGRFLVIGFAIGEIAKMPLNLPLLKSADLRGVFWGAFTQFDPKGNQANIKDLLNWLADGSLRPHIDEVFPLENTQQAIEKITARTVKGKVLLRI